MTELSPPDVVLVRYGELALKRGNRSLFERALVQNIRHALATVGPAEIERHHGRVVVRPERRVEAAARRITDVLGIKSVSPAWKVESDPEAITRVARAVLVDALNDFPADRPVTFRVRSKRADKRFPVHSADFDRFLADRVMEGLAERLPVRLQGAELELGVEVREEGSYVFVQRIPGPGGLPVGTLGRALCLLSGGIDSPVAAWLAMKRGCQVGFVSYHSYPFIGEPSKKKVADLARALARYQLKSRLYVVPFTEVQTTIRDTAPEGYRTVLYRRMMQRIATRIAERDNYAALVTGESLGQVASQTLENMTCIGAATHLPVLRPLLTYDKEEAIEVAKRIDTFDISSRPEPDCCTVFMPRKPVIRGRVADCEAAESEMDVERLIAEALDGTETVTLSYE